MANTRLILEGDTGTPVSRGEFAFILLARGLPVSPITGYDTIWLIAAHLLFNSAPLDFLLEQESAMSPHNLELLRTLHERMEDHDSADNRVDVGVWPLSVAMKFTDHIALRVAHYRNVLRPRLQDTRFKADGSRPRGYFLDSRAGENEGKPLTEHGVWTALEKGLESMKSKYPISCQRYMPLLQSPADFTKFVRWCRGWQGRVLLDQLSDDQATAILDEMPGTASQNQRLYRDLESDLQARRDAMRGQS